MIKLKEIEKLVNEFYQTDINVCNREIKYRLPRQVYCYLSRNIIKNKSTCYSFQHIADNLSSIRSHCTVIHACKVIYQDMKFDKKLRKDVEFLQNKINEINKAVY